MKGLAKAFADLNKLLKMFENMDPNTKRFSLIESNVHGALFAYKEIYDEKKETMIFAQQKNCLTMHFSECIPVVK